MYSVKILGEICNLNIYLACLQIIFEEIVAYFVLYM